MSMIPNPQAAFGGKPMGGLARIVNEYFTYPANLTPVPEKAPYTNTEPPYVSQHGTHCTECGAEVKVMSFRGSTTCSEICRKVKIGEMTTGQALKLRGGGKE